MTNSNKWRVIHYNHCFTLEWNSVDSNNTNTKLESTWNKLLLWWISIVTWNMVNSFWFYLGKMFVLTTIVLCDFRQIKRFMQRLKRSDIFQCYWQLFIIWNLFDAKLFVGKQCKKWCAWFCVRLLNGRQ